MCNIIYFQKRTFCEKLTPEEITILNVVNNISYYTNSDGSGIYSSVDDEILKSKGVFKFNKWFGLNTGDFNLIHYRKATKGANSYDNIHPFRKERNGLAVVMAHNGTVDLPVTQGGTDSEALLTVLFAAIESAYTEEKPFNEVVIADALKTAIEGIEGAYSVLLGVQAKSKTGQTFKWTFYFRNSERKAYLWETQNLSFLTTNNYEQLGKFLSPRKEIEPNIIWGINSATPPRNLAKFTPKAKKAISYSKGSAYKSLWDFENPPRAQRVSPKAESGVAVYHINEVYEFPGLPEVVDGEDVIESTVFLELENPDDLSNYYLRCTMQAKGTIPATKLPIDDCLHVSKRRMRFAANIVTEYWVFQERYGLVAQRITGEAKQRYADFMFHLLGPDNWSEETTPRNLPQLIKAINSRPEDYITVESLDYQRYVDDINETEMHYADCGDNSIYSENNIDNIKPY